MLSPSKEKLPSSVQQEKSPTKRKRVAKKFVKDFSSDDEENLSSPDKTKKSRVLSSKRIKLEKDDDYELPKREAKPKAVRKRKVAVKKEKINKTENVPFNIKEEKLSTTDGDLNGESEDFSSKKKLKRVKEEKISQGDEPSTSKPVNVKSEKFDGDFKRDPFWQDYHLLAERQQLELHTARQIIKLFEDGNTIPFIARYRRDATGNMQPEELRSVKEEYEDILHLKEKQKSVLKTIEKAGKINPNLDFSIRNAKTLDELEHIYAPYKPGARRTLAERAKNLGLEEPAMKLLQNQGFVDLSNLVNPQNKELSKRDDVEKGIIHIMAHVIATDTELLGFLRKEREFYPAQIEVKHAVAKKESKAKPSAKGDNAVDESKFQNYFDYHSSTKYIKPYQVLAINRGEALKVLSVKINVPFELQRKYIHYCSKKWLYMPGAGENTMRAPIIQKAIDDAYTRLIQPLIIREIRSDLKTKSEKAACDVFSNNVKHLLLGAPLKGCHILAIDPGYANGCKIALISPTGSVVDHNVIYPHSEKSRKKAEMVLQKMLVENGCETIALGNGTACRTTEAWLAELIATRVFSPFDIKYTIVGESGASIYSCSPEAKKEFPDLDPNIISAISLARRLQDPLAELVKIEPKHLGVGMYQHDIPKKHLEEALNEVVSECVSFTGVDLNTASQCLLRSIAGLTDKRATAIIQHRQKNGPFVCRKDLLDVKGIGPKVFEQCAGFLRVGPFSKEDETAFYQNSKANRLDRTDIHPESYDVALEIIRYFVLDVGDIGSDSFSSKILRMRTDEVSKICGLLDKPEQTISLIFDALSKPLNYDFRMEISKTPLFKKGLTNINDLTAGTILTGCVRNVCDFGCFVDIGVGQDGLIHYTKMNGLSLQIGDNAEVEVINIDISRKRIGLLAIRKI